MKKKNYAIKKKKLYIDDENFLIVISKFDGDHSDNEVYLNKTFDDHKIGTYYNSCDSWEGINYNSKYVVFTYYDKTTNDVKVKQIYDIFNRCNVLGSQEELNELYLNEFYGLQLTRKK